MWHRVGFVVAVSSLIAAVAGAQRPPDHSQQVKQAMSRLDFMVGDWKGEGWIDRGGQRFTFRGGETVTRKLDGVALLVEGNFTGKVPGVEHEIPVHTTLGVITYDVGDSVYTFDTWLGSGTSGERVLTPTDDGWWWEIRTPIGVMRYTLRRTAAGEWHEIGERSQDGETWEKFFEMTLAKDS